MIMDLRLDGQIAVVTGSSVGIGRSIARLYGQAGARVVVNSRDHDRARAVAGELAAEGIDALPIAADVGDAAEIARLFATVDERWGAPDIIVNNAGTSMIGPSETLPLESWQRTIDLNLTGAFLCAQEAARRMIPRGRGVIINISSVLGELGLPKRAAYCASKHGLNGLTKVLATEWGPTVSECTASTRPTSTPRWTRTIRSVATTRAPTSTAARRWAATAAPRRSPTPRSSWPATPVRT